MASAEESSSSSLLFAHKRPERSQRATLMSVGPDFGKKRLGLPGDEVDSGTKGNEVTAMRWNTCLRVLSPGWSTREPGVRCPESVVTPSLEMFQKFRGHERRQNWEAESQEERRGLRGHERVQARHPCSRQEAQPVLPRPQTWLLPALQPDLCPQWHFYCPPFSLGQCLGH